MDEIQTSQTVRLADQQKFMVHLLTDKVMCAQYHENPETVLKQYKLLSQPAETLPTKEAIEIFYHALVIKKLRQSRQYFPVSYTVLKPELIQVYSDYLEQIPPQSKLLSSKEKIQDFIGFFFKNRAQYTFNTTWKRALIAHEMHQTRIKINGAEHIVRSCETDCKITATAFAEKLYLQAVDKFKSTGTTKTKSYNAVFNEWIIELSRIGESQDKIDNFKENIERHSLSYWTDTSIDLISDIAIENFVTWRREKFKGLKNSTLVRGFVPIKQLFKFAYKKGYIKEIPVFPTLKNKSIPRPEFSETEWQTITNKVENWIEIAPKNQIRNRIYLKYYILIMGNTGIRTGTEAQGLKWSGIHERVFKGDPTSHILINIPTGKVGNRKTVPPRTVKTLLQELKQIRYDERKKLNLKFNEDEPIFCNKNGEGIKSFKKSFRSFLKHYNLLKSKLKETVSLLLKILFSFNSNSTIF